MNALIKTIALALAITCSVWLVVLWHWQATSRDMSVTDIVLYLGALPLALFGLVILGRWALSGADERAQRRAEAKTKAAAATPGKPTSTGELERLATMQLLAAELICAAGATARDLRSALGEKRPALDRELVDDDGMPVMCARIPDLNLDALGPALGSAVETTRKREAAWASMEPSTVMQRAMAALAVCLDATFDRLAPLRDHFVVEGDGVGTDTAASTRREARLLVFVAWPEDASPFDLAVADAWLHQAMEQRREGFIPAGRIVRPPAEPRLHGAALLGLADQTMTRMRERGWTDDMVLLLACESHIAEAAVARWQRAGLLCTSRQPKGRIPGEAAAGLLLAAGDWKPIDDDGRPRAVLHRPAVAQRNKSIDDRGRVDHAVALAAAQAAITASGLEAPAVLALMSDADQSTPRGLETYATTQALLPHLDVGLDLGLAGVVCGYTGAASTLISIALAAERALDAEAPCLALSVADSQWRAALVVRPPARPPAEPAPPSSP